MVSEISALVAELHLEVFVWGHNGPWPATQVLVPATQGLYHSAPGFLLSMSQVQ